METEINVTEIFQSIQGEVVGVGELSTFLRLGGCNLSCSWCDTKYAITDFSKMYIIDVVNRIKEFGSNRLVITGGEPLLQGEELITLIALLPSQYYVTIETNGTIVPVERLLNLVDRWNISPKFDMLNLEVINFFIKHKFDFEFIFKFVVSNEAQVKLVDELVGGVRDSVYLMPCAKSRLEYLENAVVVIDLCKKYGCNFSPREQIVLWDNKRGV